MYFDASGTLATQRTALQTAWTNMKSVLTNTTSVTVPNTGRQIDAVTGTLTGVWTNGTETPVVGTGAGDAWANATQALLRSNTSIIKNGRVLKGRTFIPGLTTGGITQGEISPGAAGLILTGFNSTFITAALPVIWSRPGPKGPGSFAPVTSYSVWNELAVQRNRRK